MKFLLKNMKLLYACLIFFLVGSILTLNFIQVDNNCVADKIKYESKKYYRTEKIKNPKLIVLIISAPSNFEQRNAIRETWLTLSNAIGKQNLVHHFVIGSAGLSADLMLHLSAEQSKYNDLLILPIDDAYSKLTNKVLQTFVWLNEQANYGLNFSYILKCDDDSFVQINLLYEEIEALEKKLITNNLSSLNNEFQTVNFQKLNTDATKNLIHIYWGYFYGNAKIKTQGKWKETNWIHCDNYIPYTLGGGYVISKGLVSYLARNSDDFMLYSAEDVSLGTWLTPVGNILRIHDVRFDTQWKSRGCQNNHLVSHKISVSDMRSMFDNIMSYGKPCVEENENMRHYLYNWQAKPSKCCM